jgi:hypothetical protein
MQARHSQEPTTPLPMQVEKLSEPTTPLPMQVNFVVRANNTPTNAGSL